MTATAHLLDTLRARGVQLERHGDRLRLMPADAVMAAELAEVRARKPELLALLPDANEQGFTLNDSARLRQTWGTLTPTERAQVQAEADRGDVLASAVLRAVAAASEVVAWRIYSQRLSCELWVARDGHAAELLAGTGLPIVLAADLDHLRHMTYRQLADLLDVLATFGGGRVVPGGADAVEESQ